MFEDISKPLKGKGKEKDVGKRRAYVRLVTSLGGASLNLELYCEKVGVFAIMMLIQSWLFIHPLGSKNLLQLLNACSSGKI